VEIMGETTPLEFDATFVEFRENSFLENYSGHSKSLIHTSRIWRLKSNNNVFEKNGNTFREAFEEYSPFAVLSDFREEESFTSVVEKSLTQSPEEFEELLTSLSKAQNLLTLDLMIELQIIDDVFTSNWMTEFIQIEDHFLRGQILQLQYFCGSIKLHNVQIYNQNGIGHFVNSPILDLLPNISQNEFNNVFSPEFINPLFNQDSSSILKEIQIHSTVFEDNIGKQSAFSSIQTAIWMLKLDTRVELIEIIDSDFYDNAIFGGAGIFQFESNEIHILNSNFENNGQLTTTAQLNGEILEQLEGVFHFNSELSTETMQINFDTCSFNNNYGKNAAIFSFENLSTDSSSESVLKISNCDFTNNSAETSSVLVSSDPNFQFEFANIIVENNQSIQKSTFTIENSKSILISEASFVNNESSYAGKSLSFSNTKEISILNSNFSDGIAFLEEYSIDDLIESMKNGSSNSVFRGAAHLIFKDIDEEIRIDSCVFDSIGIAELGAAIQATQSANIIINASTFNLCIGSLGGAIHITSSTTLDIQNSFFTNNIALKATSIFIEDYSNLFVTNTEFQFNTAEYAGVISSEFNCFFALENSIFNQNTATKDNSVMGVLYSNPSVII
jgi:hypothetical protein